MEGFKGFNSGCFLTGKGGSGKSGILTYVNAWAHENKWVVISVPKGRYWSSHHGEPE
jgi:Mitochondrial ribosomal death-associated protein 3